MIILNNRLYSCEQCILRNEGQKCEHYQDILISVHKVDCVAKTRKGFHTSSQAVSGRYRLLIRMPPAILKSIELSKHLDEEILFNKQLAVDTNKSVGKQIYILENFTKVEICPEKKHLDQTFILPFGLSNTPHSHQEFQSTYHRYTSVPSTSNTIKGTNEVSELSEPVIVRPFSRIGDLYPVTLHRKLTTSKGHRKHPFLPLDGPILTSQEQHEQEVILKSNNSSSSCALEQDSIEIEKESAIQQRGGVHDSRLSKINIDQFLDDTQKFIEKFCTDSNGETK